MKKSICVPYRNVCSYIALLVAILLSFNKTIAQISPINTNSGWILKPAISDDFNNPLNLIAYPWNNQAPLTNNLWHPMAYRQNGQPFDYQTNIISDPQGYVRLIFTGNSPDPGPSISNAPNGDPWWGGPNVYPKPHPACDWKTGGMYSNPWRLPPGNQLNYLYGYFEIFAKLPGYISNGASTNPSPTSINVTGQTYFNHGYPYDYSASPLAGNMTNRGIRALWWFEGEEKFNCFTGECFKDEVDMMEGHMYPTTDFRPNGIPSHWFIKKCSVDGTCQDLGHGDASFFSEHTEWPKNGEIDKDVVNQFHKYGFEWMPDRMIFYFDDVPYYINYNVPGIPQHPMVMHLELSVNTPAHCEYPPNPNNTSVWQYPNALIEEGEPIYTSYNPLDTKQFVIDYFKYYQMNMTSCQSNTFITNSNDLDNFPGGVWQNIDVTGSATLSNNQKVIRHSGDFTVVYGNSFYVPLGTDLTILPTPCH